MKTVARIALLMLSIVATTWAGEEKVKPAPPTQAVATASLRTVRQTHKEAIAGATTRQGKQELARQLLEAVPDEAANPNTQYAIIELAKSMFVEDGNIGGMMNAIAVTDQNFKVDALKLKFDALMSMGRTLKDNDGRKDFLNIAADVIDEGIDNDRYEVAKPLGDLYGSVAKLLGDFVLSNEATARLSQLKDCEQSYIGAKKAVAILKDKPTDGDANTTVGKYTCFLKGDWETGMPMLAAGSDETLKTLANRDLLAKTDAEIVAAADAWYDHMAKLNGTSKEMARRHTLSLYDKAVPGLTGLAKTKGETRQRALQPVRVGVVVIEALVEGGSQLHVTKQGIYWSHNTSDRAKPGKADGQDLPTYINDKEWMPKWGRPDESKGYDKTEVRKLEMGDYSVDLQVVAMGSKRGAKDRENYYGMPTSNFNDNDTSIYCSNWSSNNGQSSAVWYTFEITPKAKGPPGPWKAQAGTYEAVFNNGGTLVTDTYTIDDQGKVLANNTGGTYRGRTYGRYTYETSGQMVKKGQGFAIDFGGYMLMFRQTPGGTQVDKYWVRNGTVATTPEVSGTFKRK